MMGFSTAYLPPPQLIILLLQGFLLQPHFQRSALSRLTRLLLTPIGVFLAIRTGFSARQPTPKDGRSIMGLMAAATDMGNTVLRIVMWGTTTETYWRLGTDGLEKRGDAAKPAVRPTVARQLLFPFMLMTSPRGTGWSFGPKTVVRSECYDGSMRDDVKFLLSTLRRYLFLHLVSIINVAWLTRLLTHSSKGFYTDTLQIPTQIATFLSTAEPWILTFLVGVFGWTMMDVGNCVFRLGSVGLKICSRIFDPDQKTMVAQMDLNEYSFIMNHPYRATSLAELWGRRWHSMMRQLFVECGSRPVEIVIVKLAGCRSHAAISAGKIIGAFLVSGLLHEYALWYATYLDRGFNTTMFFLSSGVGVCVESMFKRLTGRRVGGLAGWVWTFTWLVYWGERMIRVWSAQGVLDPSPLVYETIFNQGFQVAFVSPLFNLRVLLKCFRNPPSK